MALVSKKDACLKVFPLLIRSIVSDWYLAPRRFRFWWILFSTLDFDLTFLECQFLHSKVPICNLKRACLECDSIPYEKSSLDDELEDDELDCFKWLVLGTSTRRSSGPIELISLWIARSISRLFFSRNGYTIGISVTVEHNADCIVIGTISHELWCYQFYDISLYKPILMWLNPFSISTFHLGSCLVPFRLPPKNSREPYSIVFLVHF